MRQLIGQPPRAARARQSARKVAATVGMIALTTGLFPTIAHAQQVTLTQRNTQSLGAGQAFGQLSGLTYVGGNEWLAVSDKRNELLPITIGFNAGTGATTTLTSGVKRVLGGAERDYEGIAFTGATRNTLLVSEEDSPGVREFDRATLAEVATSPLPTPGVFAANLRGNLGFESLTYHATSGAVFTANEEALVSDGPTANAAMGTTVRVQRFAPSGASFIAQGQWAYVVDPIHGTNSTTITSPAAQSGLSDLVALDDGRLLALERSVFYMDVFGQGFPPLPNFLSKIYLISPTGTPANADVLHPLSKTLLWSGSLGISGNLEGLALGPATTNGRLVLGIVDNNDIDVLAASVVAFEMTIVPEPGSMLLITGASGALLARRSRR